METFGNVKSRILKQLTEAYIAKDKKLISSIINLIKENSTFFEVYKIYDIVEEKQFDDKDIALTYVNEVSELLEGKSAILKKQYKKFNGILIESKTEKNKLYDALDHLLDTNNIRNIDKKIIAKKTIVEFLTKKEPVQENLKVENFTSNEALLTTVLINNFNSKFSSLLEDEDKEKLKEIMTFSFDEIKEKIEESKNNIREKLKILSEENNTLEVNNKLQAVANRIEEMDDSRLSYYKITQLEKDL
jgi:hypothetical protein